jgi:hypothetical protein
MAGNRAVTRLLAGDASTKVPGMGAGPDRPLPIQRRTGDDDAEAAEAKVQIRRLLINPEVSADKVIRLIEDADIDLLAEIPEFADKGRLAILAGSTQGRRVLSHVADLFGKAKRWSLENPIREILERHSGAQEVVVFKSDQDAIDAINRAIEGEGGFLKMVYGDWLSLPVTQLRTGAEEEGGVYYDKGLKGKPTTLGQQSKTAAGKTEAIGWKPEPEPGVTEERIPLIYIRLGPAILEDLTSAADAEAVKAAEAYIRSALYHEFQHYTDYRKLRDPTTLGDDRRLITLEENAETRAYAAQIWRYYEALSAPQIQKLLVMLAEDFDVADEEVRDHAVGLIAAAVRDRDLPGAMAHEEFLDTFKGLDAEVQKRLAPLKASIVADKEQIEAKERLFNSVAGP